MLKIRLRRMGSRHRPFYRLVVSDSRRRPTSAALEELGYYDPRQTPAVLRVDLERVDHWVGTGAQLSETVRKLVDNARAGRAVDVNQKREKPAPPAPAKAAEPAAEAAEPAAEAAEPAAEAEAPAADAEAGDEAKAKTEGED